MNEFEQQLLTALQTKFDGVDAKILGRIARKFAKTATDTSEENAKTIADGITFQQVLESYSDFRVTEATKTTILNYEKAHNLRDGKPISQEQPDQTAEQGGENVPAWAKQLMEDNKTLRSELDAYRIERTSKSRLEQFRKAVEPLPTKVKERYEKDFARLSFKDDQDFSDYISEITPDIAAIAQQVSQQGARVSSPLIGQGNGTEASQLVKERFEAVAKADTAPAIAGLPTNKTN